MSEIKNSCGEPARKGQFGPLDEALQQLATKDAEIAELRARVAEQQEAVDQAVALVEYLEGHSKGAMAERVKMALSAKFAQERAEKIAMCQCDRLGAETVECAQIVGEALMPGGGFHIGHLPDMCRDLVLSRDEARECVGRLYGVMRESTEYFRTYSTWPEGIQDDDRDNCGRVLDAADTALAATPEHLRK
jgi:hypothetical protein